MESSFISKKIIATI